jgi:nitrous oxide reductase accessory protein NosL
MMKKIVWMMSIAGIVWLMAAEQVPFTGKIMQLEKKLDPVYAIAMDKYPKWHCTALLKNGKKAVFISVKSMMQAFFHQPYFLKHKLLDAKIDKMYVKDFLTQKEVDATKALYVFGSRKTGPHGDDLIPFATEANAKLFMMKYGGSKILPFSKLSVGLIRYLDMQ